VTSLLDQPSGPDHILKHVAFDLVGDDGVPQLAAGADLGPYRIEGLLGSGSMGIVYRARDTRLNRDVAAKISARQFSGRFQREARLIASLNHPKESRNPEASTT
jgi:serine/threonine protein kinase